MGVRNHYASVSKIGFQNHRYTYNSPSPTVKSQFLLIFRLAIDETLFIKICLSNTSETSAKTRRRLIENGDAMVKPKVLDKMTASLADMGATAMTRLDAYGTGACRNGLLGAWIQLRYAQDPRS